MLVGSSARCACDNACSVLGGHLTLQLQRIVRREREKAEALRRLEEAELMLCTFAPHINSKSKKLAASRHEVLRVDLVLTSARLSSQALSGEEGRS